MTEDKREIPTISITPELTEIYKRESTNLQYKKLFLNVSLVVILTIIALCQGDGKTASFVGISKCDSTDLAMTALLITISLSYLLYAIFGVLRPEYKQKVACGYKFTQGDFECTLKNASSLSAIAFLGASVGSCCGTGTGYIFNPVLIATGIDPAVASATGMYLTLFVTLSASIVMSIFGMVTLDYCILLSILTVIGSAPGIILQPWLVKKTGNPVVTVIIV